MIKASQVILALVVACNAPVWGQNQSAKVLPHVIVYKTKKDYRNLVPVQLSADKKQVVSYPDQADIGTGGANALPVLLHKGYLLDRRGVGINSAFTKYTYKQYNALKELPPPDELLRSVKDKNPMVVVYDCGIRRSEPELIKDLNKWIDHGEIGSKCKVVK